MTHIGKKFPTKIDELFMEKTHDNLRFRRSINFSIKIITLIATVITSSVVLLVALYLFSQSIDILSNPRDLFNILFGRNWNPKELKFGGLNLFIGSAIVTFYAIIFAIPFGIGIGVLLAEIMKKRLKQIIKPILELIFAIPSVIIGLLAFRYLAEIMRNTFKLLGLGGDFGSGRIALTASIALSFMVIPLIASLVDDALSSVSHELKESAYALGASKWEVITGISLRSSLSSIISSIILAFGRVFGETMVVLMVAAGNPSLNRGWWNPLQPVYPIPAAIALENGDVVIGDPQWHALFTLGLELFLVSIFIASLSRSISNRKINFLGLKERTKHLITPISGHFRLIFKFKRSDKIEEDLETEPGDIKSEELVNTYSKKKIVHERVFFTIFWLMLVIIFTVLIAILVIIIKEGVAKLNFFDLFRAPSFTLMVQGHFGYLQATVGTLIVVSTAAIIGLPLSTLAGIFIFYYIKNKRIKEMLNTTIQNIATVPSVVIGLFGWGLFVNIFGWGKCVLSGGATLAIMMIPIATSTTIEALKNINPDFTTNALALGATKWQAIKSQGLRYGFPSIITGYLFSVARVLGETAPIILTVAASVYSKRIFPASLIRTGVSMLPFEIYTQGLFGTSPYSFYWAMSCSLILLGLSMFLYILGQVLRIKLNIRNK